MRFIFALFLLSVSATAAYSQQAAATPPADEVVKITSKLVQFDAVVTDKDGKQVTDLQADDFEILEDGEPQKIKYFSYVNSDLPGISGAAPRRGSEVNALPPATRTSSSGVGRIITFVVDDGNCSASQVGMVASREALEKFIRQQMLPSDRVAIYQTRSGSSIFQQYTSDKALLLRVAKKIRWFPPIGPCATSDGSFYAAAKPNTYDKSTPDGVVVKTIESESERKIRESNEDLSRSNQIVGTLGVLRYVIRGLEQGGGRKLVFFMSDGLPVRSRSGTQSQTQALAALRDITDLANRASVVFNTIDVRGIFDPSTIEARDSVSTRDDPAASEKVVVERSRDVRNAQDGLNFLAQETGGNFYYNQNFLDVPVSRALSLEKGYYLLAYEPEDETFKGKNFNSIEIRTKRPGLRVVSRAGFLGKASEPAARKKRTEDSDLYDAIAAPLPRAGLDLRLTVFFGNGKKEGNFVRSLTHIDGDDISFVDSAGGTKTALIDVVAVTMNEKNEVIDEFNRKHTFRIDAAAIPLIKQNGIVYTTDVPIKKPGVYTFRVAMRDGTSKTVGSASQVVQIPDLTKRDLTLSALTLSEPGPDGKFAIPSTATPENAISMVMTPTVPAVRRFRRGAVLAYAYTLYNAKPAQGSNQPRLSVQVNLYRNGELVLEGKPQPAELQQQPDISRISDYGYLRMDPLAVPGDYALQVIVRDLSAQGKPTEASQWVDFEITEK